MQGVTYNLLGQESTKHNLMIYRSAVLSLGLWSVVGTCYYWYSEIWQRMSSWIIRAGSWNLILYFCVFSKFRVFLLFSWIFGLWELRETSEITIRRLLFRDHVPTAAAHRSRCCCLPGLPLSSTLLCGATYSFTSLSLSLVFGLLHYFLTSGLMHKSCTH